MPRRTESYQLINTSIAVLALSVLTLTSHFAWQGYGKVRAAQQLVHLNRMIDGIIRAAGQHALERGMTAAMLGARRPSEVALRADILAARKRGDAAWSDAVLAGRALGRSIELSALLDAANAEFLVLQKLRATVDEHLDGHGPAVDADVWFETISRFIDSGARAREDAFSVVEVAHELVRFSASLKQQAWLASEYAGRERGMLAFYLSGERPVPTAAIEQLRAYRGVTEYSVEKLLAYARLPHADARIVAAIREMEGSFLGNYENVRRQVYAGAASGRYGMGGGAWVRLSTDAIDTILAVGAAVSQVIEGHAKTAQVQSAWGMGLHASLALLALLMAIFSVTRVMRTTRALFHEKELAEVTLHSIGDAVITTDASARVEYMNPIAETLTGWALVEAQGRPLSEVFRIVNGHTRAPQVNPVERCLKAGRIVGLENNTVLLKRDGTELSIEDSAAPVRDREGEVVGAVMVFFDGTHTRGVGHLLSYQATHDSLTGLINRREFERRLNELLESAKQNRREHVLLYLDLDQFKLVNDTCGHAAGDQLMRQLTPLFRQRLRDSDVVARLGGDEFGILLSHCPTDVATRIAEDLLRLVKNFRFVWEDKVFEVGVSIGLVPITADSISEADLLREADAACYAAKDKGRHRVQVFRPNDAELARRQGDMQWVSRINRALLENGFSLYQQPIVPLRPAADKVQRCEVLLRKLDDNGRLVLPGAFIPAAERYGLMPAIDRWVVQNVFQSLRRLRHNEQGYICSINLSGATLSDDRFLRFVEDQLATTGVPPEAVCFEITETAAIANLHLAMRFIETLRLHGCRFALDDFGSGMSSFSYLRTLKIDYLKIAGSFIQQITTNALDRTMVDTINRIGHVMAIETVAEFVESEAAVAVLRELGIDYVQGYAVAIPTPLQEFVVAVGKQMNAGE